MISADAQINRCGKCKVILGPAGHVQSVWPAGNKTPFMDLKYMLSWSNLQVFKTTTDSHV